MALSFNSPTPSRLRRPDHPSLFLLGFSLNSFQAFLCFFNGFDGGSKTRGRAGGGQGRAGQGRAGRGGAGRGGAGRGGAGWGGAGREQLQN